MSRFILIAVLCVSSVVFAAAPKSGYANVNGVKMYYEISGSGPDLVLLHGGICTIEGCFGALIPSLAKNRRVIAFEFQAHGHTPDIDRKLSVDALVSDTLKAMDQLGVKKTDLLGYSMGAAVALELAVAHPERVNKLMLLSGAFSPDGVHPGMNDMSGITPELFKGTPWLASYEKAAPASEKNGVGFAKLINRIKEVDDSRAIDPEKIRALKSPVFVLIGDSDIITPEHAVKLFRLVGGGVAGDMVPMANSRLAILPATTHARLMERAPLIAQFVTEFLAAETR
ncbi:MAG: alpha/beta hydrolase [Archangium sp.]|nr:alpha/beta hydrolase [Archangium sp.]